jgi:DNA-binding transcriptional regulator PaaX
MLDAVPLKRPGARQGISTGADDEAVLNAVQQLNGHATQTAVRAALSDQMGMSKNRVLDALQRLTNSGKLTSSRGAKNANFYQPS